MRAILVCVSIGLSVVSPAEALVGGADVVRSTGAGRHIVMIISTRGSLCTGTALARDLVLTGGHCVAPAASYRVLLPDIKPPGLAIRSARSPPVEQSAGTLVDATGVTRGVVDRAAGAAA